MPSETKREMQLMQRCWLDGHLDSIDAMIEQLGKAKRDEVLTVGDLLKSLQDSRREALTARDNLAKHEETA